MSEHRRSFMRDDSKSAKCWALRAYPGVILFLVVNHGAGFGLAFWSGGFLFHGRGHSVGRDIDGSGRNDLAGLLRGIHQGASALVFIGDHIGRGIAGYRIVFAIDLSVHFS